MDLNGLLLMGLLNNRRRMLYKPYDYEVEYIETPETIPYIYIDTEQIIDTTDFVIEVDFQYLKKNNWGYILSNEYGSGNYTRISLNGNTEDLCCTYIHKKATIVEDRLDIIGVRHKYVLDGVNRKLHIDNDSYDLLEPSTINNKNSIILFLGSPTGTTQGVGRMYSYKYIREGKVILDMIPVVKNGIGYMYDKVSHKLFGAQGGGKFIVGPKLYDYRVQYIEMNDIENPSYLDLGVVLEENVYDVYGEFTLLGYGIDTLPYSGWFGCWNDIPNYSIYVNKHWQESKFAACNIAASSEDRARTFEITYNTKYNILLKKNSEVYVNGDYIGKSNSYHYVGGTNTFKVFYRNYYSGYEGSYTRGRIHRIKIWKEDKLIHDFIPVVKDGNPYMYDNIGRTFSTTVGNGNLTVGPKIN